MVEESTEVGSGVERIFPLVLVWVVLLVVPRSQTTLRNRRMGFTAESRNFPGR